MPEPPYNPLDKRNLGASVAGALLRQPVGPLPPAEAFAGAGIYAIYYSGPFPLYAPISRKNRGGTPEQPIYVGKAVPAGARTGRFGLGLPAGPALFNRLTEHARSIAQVNLEITDFLCHFLVADDIWIPLGEALLIERFQPLWNVLIDGFGNHDPGSGRYNQQRSKWDTLHQGRSWAALLKPNQQSTEEIDQLVRDFFSGKPVTTIRPEEAVADDDGGS